MKGEWRVGLLQRSEGRVASHHVLVAVAIDPGQPPEARIATRLALESMAAGCPRVGGGLVRIK
jgi:hypothetical protein